MVALGDNFGFGRNRFRRAAGEASLIIAHRPKADSFCPITGSFGACALDGLSYPQLALPQNSPVPVQIQIFFLDSRFRAPKPPDFCGKPPLTVSVGDESRECWGSPR